jgi:PAS domain S-box-containing protein
VSAFGTVQDITERKRSEAALRAAHDELEIRVEARTAALKSTNQMLYTEVAVRKRAEQALSESRAMLADILGSAMDAIISIDANHRIILFNTAAEATFGCSAAEAVGQPIETFIPERLRGRNQDHVAAFAEAATAAPPTGRRCSMVGLRANGEEFPIEAAISYSDAGGEAVSTIILRDVSERQRAEERLRKLSRAIEQTADSVMVANRECIIEYFNRAFEELTGYSRAEAMGARPTFVKAGRHDIGFYGALWKTILSGQSFRSIFTNTSKDGRVYHEDQTITPIRDGNGEITHFVSTGRDITQRKRTEEALRRLNDALEREATRIASVLHDEAGQFLTAAHITLADVARQLPEPAKEALKEVRRDLNQIEHQLRRLSHELHPRILDDLGLIDAVKFLADGVQRRTGVTITVEGTLEERCSPLVETAIYRLVQEALTNMTKHAGATRATITLQRDASMIRCSIRDDGVGFEVADVLDRRRDPGLGLIGIQDRLEVVGGTLEIISAPGGGTELRATIPLTA